MSRYVQLCESKSGKVFFDKLTFIYLEVPRFSKEEGELETDFEKWMFVLKNLHRFKGRPARLEGRIFEKLFRAAEIEQFNPEERHAYDESLKYYRDLKNVLDTARVEGLEQGRELGVQEGERRVAKALIEKGMSPEEVVSVTSLSLEQVLALKVS